MNGIEHVLESEDHVVVLRIRLERMKGPARDLLAEIERVVIEKALKRERWNQSAAARMLGLSRYALRYRMKRHGIPMQEPA